MSYGLAPVEERRSECECIGKQSDANDDIVVRVVVDLIHRML